METFRIYATPGRLIQSTPKLELKAEFVADAARAWLKHKSNKAYAAFNLITPGRHEGFTHLDVGNHRVTYKEWRFTATDEWNLKAITIWVEQFSHAS